MCLNGPCHGNAPDEIREVGKRNQKKKGRRIKKEILKIFPVEPSVISQDYLGLELFGFLLFLKWGHRIIFLLLLNILRV